ncbi:PREDICTED: uncharacterized protein LOC103321750 [Prunus mume]|uniref:Uncharacterized protein LOC103321750 n=1 Tax=Prunus mume TaxID=102107 RepID=A0ABM0NAC4_PRUMU|nr:PREDICTED: uncharacterized protein LOC103321750 [Prunus mume]
MNQKDPAWKYAKEIEGEKYLRCAFCDQRCSGGISRLKHHLGQTHHGMQPCKKVPEHVKKECAVTLKNLQLEKRKKNEMLREIGDGLEGGALSMETSLDEEYGIPGTRSAAVDETLRAQPKSKGPMDRFVTLEARQSTLNSAYKQEERKEVCRKIGRFFFSRALPFNIVNDPFWLPMVEGIAAYGVGFKPPSMHELRTWILKEEVGYINTMIEEHKKAWAEYGCTIMSDGWTDGKNRVLINFLVNSLADTWFLKSIDASDSIKNGTLLLKYLDDVVEEVGEEHVIQVITDNASNYKNAGVKLMEKRKKLWWTPCAAHCIDLMLEDISKMKVFEDTIRLAKQVVKFIYGHTWVLALMRSFTKNKEIIRLAITRFATSYLTLRSIYKQKQPLQAIFSSREWHNRPFVQHNEGIRAHSTILYDVNFWSRVAFCIKSVIPLVSVLREVNSEERPAMRFIYELMDVAKEKIAFNCGKVERKYKPIWRKIDERWGPQLHQPLHAAGYYLNPQLRYEETFSNADEVRKGLEDCMTRMLSFEDRMTADIQLDLYDEAKGEFGSRLAVNSRKLRTPANWWKLFGRDTPELTKFAIRVLSLTCNASGCERNWSTFEQKRNRLEHQKLNALVYVKYNTALREKSIKRRSKIDPILVNEIESDDEWIAEVEEPILPTDLIWLNSQELYDVDVIRNMPTEPYETDLHTRVPISVEPIGKRKVKSKSIRAMLMDEDDEIDKDPSTFDSGKYPFHIDTVDQYDSDASLNDISVEERDE